MFRCGGEGEDCGAQVDCVRAIKVVRGSGDGCGRSGGGRRAVYKRQSIGVAVNDYFGGGRGRPRVGGRCGGAGVSDGIAAVGQFES